MRARGHSGSPAPDGSRRQLRRPASPAAIPDERYLDGRDARLASRWLTGRDDDRRTLARLLRRLPRVKDDFVDVQPPRLASRALDGVLLAEAIRHYRQEASIVDPRLFRTVTLQVKAGSVDELCAALQQQTSVRFGALRGVGDEKLTVLVREQPARDLMRAVARLFGYRWARSGEEGAWRYDLRQDLRSQIEEEEARNRDLNAALLAMDAEMEKYRPFLGRSVAQLKERLSAGRDGELVKSLVESGGWGGLQAYERMTPAERLSLRSGGEVRFTMTGEEGTQRLPDEWVRPLLQSWKIGVNLGTTNGREFWRGETPLDAAPEATPALSLRVNRSELGELRLESALQVSVRASEHETKGSGVVTTLALGRSPSVSKPENAAANRALRGQPPFDRTITLAPKAVSPMGPATAADLAIEDSPQLALTGLTSAEVWEEVHRRSGLNVVTDFYTRLHPAADFQIKRASAFDALCQAGDQLGVRWKKDGAFFLGRSTSYVWDKLKEVPNRQLRRWQEERRRQARLPFDDLLEMATCTDQQLDSRFVAEGIVHGWSLREWGLLSDRNSRRMRESARWIAGMTAGQRGALLGSAGIGFGDLNLEQQKALLAIAGPLEHELARLGGHLVQQLRLRAQYCPSGWYWWAPRDPDGAVQVREVLLVGRERGEVLAAARRIDPQAGGDHVRRSEGDLHLVGEIPGRIRFGQSRTHGFFHVLRAEDRSPPGMR